MTTHLPNEKTSEPTQSSWLDRLAEKEATDTQVPLITPAGSPDAVDGSPNKHITPPAQESLAWQETSTNESSRWMKYLLVLISIIAALEAILILSSRFGSGSSYAITRLPDSAGFGSVGRTASTSSSREKDLTENRPELIVSSAGDTSYTTIASAIEAAKEGSLILVKPGIYRENVVLNKSLTIQGDGKREDIRVESSSGTVMAIEAPQVVVRGLTIARLSGAGDRALQAVEIRSGQATLDDCDVASATGNGIEVIGVDAVFKLTRCRLHDTVENGVWLKVGASCEVIDCDFEKISETCFITQVNTQSLIQKSRFSNSKVGIFVNRAQSHIFDCNFSGFSSSAVQVNEKSKVTIDACEISKCTETSIMVLDESTLNITRCKILDSKVLAVSAKSRSQLQVSDTEIMRSEIAIYSSDADVICCRLHVQDCNALGLSVQRNSNVVLLDSAFRDYAGIHVTNDGILTALRCRFLDSKNAGIAISENASITMNHSEIGASKGACIVCNEKSTLSLTSCKIHGSLTQGILGTDDARTRLVDCEVFDHGDQLILLRNRHRLSIEGGKLYSTKTVGVLAAESVSVSIRDCQIEGCQQLGVRILSDQIAQFVNVGFKKNGVSVYLDKSGKTELISCKSVEAIKYDWHTVEGGELIGKNNSPDLSEKRVSQEKK